MKLYIGKHDTGLGVLACRLLEPIWGHGKEYHAGDYFLLLVSDNRTQVGWRTCDEFEAEFDLIGE